MGAAPIAPVLAGLCRQRCRSAAPGGFGRAGDCRRRSDDPAGTSGGAARAGHGGTSPGGAAPAGRGRRLLPLVVLASSLLPQGGRCDADVEANEAACREQFLARAADFVAFSGAPTSAPTSAEVPPQEGGAAAEDEWMANRFAPGDFQFGVCAELGGRYWETNFHTEEYIRHVRFSGDVTAVETLESSGDSDELLARFRLLPGYLRCGVCVPSVCDANSVRTVVYGRFMAAMLRLDFDLPPPEWWEFEARELAQWSDVNLDFVIVGAGHCGTTSLRLNLLKHPEVDFTIPGEDPWFGRHSRMLPYKEEVTNFNQERNARGGGQSRFKVLGLGNPRMLQNSRMRHVFARMPRLRAIAIVCDPVSRFDKFFWNRIMCRTRDESGPSPSWGCYPSLSAAFDWPSASEQPTLRELMAEDAIGEHLFALRARLGSRLLVVHQDSLRHDPRRTFDGIAAFIGAAPFPPEADFKRYNSVRGHRTDLCRNASILRYCQRHLEPEYEALEKFLGASGVEVPASLKQRRTRCDRPEELLPELASF